MRKFCLGDLHGEHQKLVEILKIVNFDYDNDRLVHLGDVVDRGPDSFLCVDELLKIKNLVAIRGNHDACWRDAAIHKQDPIGNKLYNQGGRETFRSYLDNCFETSEGGLHIPADHIRFFLRSQVNYFVDEDNNCFVHGGFNRHQHIKNQSETILNWDRDLFLAALSYKSMKDNSHPFKIKDNFKNIFVGHTPTLYWNSELPIFAANIVNLDTACGKGGKLTIMDTDTLEYWQI